MPFSGNFFLKLLPLHKIALLKDYYLGSCRNVSPPRIISLRMLSPENSYSVYSGCDGFYGLKENNSVSVSAELSIESIQRLVDFAAVSGSEFLFWGDNVLKNPSFFEFLKYMSLKKVPCRILTRFGRFEPYISFFQDNTIREIIFSFDESPAQKAYAKKSFLYDDYRETIDSINFLINFRRKAVGKKYLVSGSMIINADNCYLLDDMISWANVHCMDRFYFFHSPLVSWEQGKKQSGVYLDCFGTSVSSWEKKVAKYTNVEPSSLILQLRTLSKNRYKTSYSFSPNLRPWQIPIYYSDFNFSAGFDKCYAPWFMMNITESGDVVSCSNHPDLILGNINTGSPGDLWNGERISEFRSEVMCNGRFSLCSRCNCLYI